MGQFYRNMLSDRVKYYGKTVFLTKNGTAMSPFWGYVILEEHNCGGMNRENTGTADS